MPRVRSKNHATNSALAALRISKEKAAKILFVGQYVDYWQDDEFRTLRVIDLPVQNVRTGGWFVRLEGIDEPVNCADLTIRETSVIEWHDDRIEKPDDSLTVLVGFADGEVVEGYYDSEFSCWRNTEAVRFDGAIPVVAWAELPAVPKAFLRDESEVPA